MSKSQKKDQGNGKFAEIKTIPVPLTLGAIQESIAISTNTTQKLSKEQIINQAIRYHLQGNIRKASELYQHFIN